MATSLRILSAAVSLLLLISSAAAFSGVHDVLEKFGLPKGLLPHSAKIHSLADDGTFEVHLDEPCYVQFTDLVYYGKIITGKISYREIEGISGIQVKKLFAWLPITVIEATEDAKAIIFHAGFLTESLPASMFKEAPNCRNKASARGTGGFFPQELFPVAEVR